MIKPVNTEALTRWLGHIPEDVLQDMAHIAPMLARLGYDPYANPPNYGNPDPLVINNTHRVSAPTPAGSHAPPQVPRPDLGTAPLPGWNRGRFLPRSIACLKPLFIEDRLQQIALIVRRRKSS